MRISDWSSDVCSSDRRLPILVIEADIAHEQRRLPAVAVDIDAAHRPRPAAPAIVADQPVAQRLLRIFLELRIKRGAHPQAAGIDAVQIGRSSGRESVWTEVKDPGVAAKLKK